jgi:alpha-L-fucosidase
MILSPTPVGDGWSYRTAGKTLSFNESLKMLVSTVAGGGNLLLNLGPDQFGELRPSEVAIAERLGMWLQNTGTRSMVRAADLT